MQNKITGGNLALVKILGWLLTHQNPEDGSFQESYLYTGFRDDQLPSEYQRITLTARLVLLMTEMSAEVSKEVSRAGK